MNAVDQAGAVIRDAISEFGSGAAVLTSFQREGMIVADLALREEPRCRVYTIDTGRLPAATLRMIATVESYFGIHVHRIVPDAAEVEVMVDVHGRNLFRDSVAKRMLCCDLRKVRPLDREMRPGGTMADVTAIFVGLRREQNDSRGSIPLVDRAKSLVRVSPLASWTSKDVLEYTRDRGLPEHPFYAEGYRSIGCDPCTRAVTEHEAERAGRWWWESEADKECGLHFTPDGRAVREVDVLLEDILERSRLNEVRA